MGGGREWTADDAILDADARGALGKAVADTLALFSAEDEGPEIDSGELQKASERFRYEHDLITAGETEEWLAARGMTVDDFSDWLYARLCGAARFSAPITRAEEFPDDFPELLHIHLWLSGEMDRIGDELRRRVAAQIETGSASRDEAHERVVRGVLTGEARRRRLDMLRVPLTRLEVDWLELDSEPAAREAMLCVREDGDTLAQVAANAGYAVRRESLWAEDAGKTIAPQAAFANDGELLGPIRAADRTRLCQIVRRIEPSLDDREVAARVDSMLLDEHFNELCARHTPLPVVARTTL